MTDVMYLHIFMGTLFIHMVIYVTIVYIHTLINDDNIRHIKHANKRRICNIYSISLG